MQRRNPLAGGIVLAVLLCWLPAPAEATDRPGILDSGDLRLTVGLGYLTAEANEYVYIEGRTVSRLIWEVKSAATLEASAELDVTPRLQLYGSASVGLAADGFMVDYDWLLPIADWSDQSHSADTRLDHYFSFGVGTSYAFLKSERSALKLMGGLRYTDLKMTAYGGDYVYSSGGGGPGAQSGFRDLFGSSPPDERGITYRQRLPALYVGLGLEHQLGRIGLDFGVMGGYTIAPRDSDEHWVRRNSFREKFDSSPYLALQLRATMPVSRRIEGFFSAKYEKFFPMRGDIHFYDHADGMSVLVEDSAGASLSALTLGLGLKVKF